MQIECPSCAARYVMNPSALGGSGRNVRCAKCGVVWFASAPVPEQTLDIPEEMAKPPFADFSSQLQASMDAPVSDLNLTEPANYQVPGFLLNKKPMISKKTLIALLLALSVLIALYLALKSGTKPAANGANTVSAVPYKGKDLDFANIRAVEQGESTARILILSGKVRNSGHSAMSLPALSAKLSDSHSAQAMEWIFHLPQSTLAPGQSTEFEITKPDLTLDGEQLSLSFVLEK